MKKLLAMYICVSALVYGFNAKASGLDMPPLDNSHTQFSLVPESVFDNSSSFQMARTYFMPDYQRNLVGKQFGGRVNDGGSTGGDRGCSTYGLVASCPSNAVPKGIKHPIMGLTCYEKCVSCATSGYVDSCPYPKIETGIIHPIPELTCYTNCLCPADYKYITISSPATYMDGHQVSYCNVSSGATVGGGSCTTAAGTTLYKTCTCSAGYKLQGSSCVKKSCSEYNGAYKDTIPNNYKCTPVSSSLVDGLTCYKDCSLKTCTDYGYLSAKPAQKACSTVTPYTGLTCYNNCKSCSDYNSSYKDAIPADNKCSTVSSTLVGGLTCYTNCSLKTCTDYNSSYKTNIPSGYKCDEITPRSGLKCYHSCTKKTCTDYNTTYKSSVPDDYKCTQVATSSVGGLTCYTGCALKTCTDYNSSYKTSIPTDNKCTSVTPRSGLTCYHSCSLKGCSDYSYSASIPSGQTCTSVTPRSGLTCYKDCKASGYQKVAIAFPGNSIFAYAGPNFGQDATCEGKMGINETSTYCFWPEGAVSGFPWGGTMAATRVSDDSWDVNLNGVCYVTATKVDGTNESKTFPFSGNCLGVSTACLDWFKSYETNCLCRSQLEHFNSGKTAGNLGIPHGTDNVLLCQKICSCT